LLSEDVLRAFLPEDVVLSSSGPFSNVLAQADLLTSFSSTTIEEALMSQIPVALYEPEGRYHHLPGARWLGTRFARRDAVYHFDHPDQLLPGLEWIRDHDLIQPPDTERFVFHRQPADCPSAAEVIRSRALLRENKAFGEYCPKISASRVEISQSYP